jgi:hypothetical protein
MQHAVTSPRHFACKVIPQNFIAIPSTISPPLTKCLDIRLLRSCGAYQPPRERARGLIYATGVVLAS